MNLHLLKSSCKSCTARLAPNAEILSKAISLLDPAVVFSAETLSTTRTGEEDDDNSDKDEAGGDSTAGADEVGKRNGCRTQQLYVL